MPFGNSGASRERIQANNQVALPDKSYSAKIVDAWIFNVVEEGRTSDRTGEKYTKRAYTKNLTDDQDVEIKVALTLRPDIVLSTTMRVYLGNKAKFAQLMDGLGIAAPGKELELYLLCGHEQFDAKEASKKLRQDLVGSPVTIKTERNDAGYVSIRSMTALPTEDGGDDLASIPPQTNAALHASPAASTADDLNWDDLERDGVPF